MKRYTSIFHWTFRPFFTIKRNLNRGPELWQLWSVVGSYLPTFYSNTCAHPCYVKAGAITLIIYSHRGWQRPGTPPSAALTVGPIHATTGARWSVRGHYGTWWISCHGPQVAALTLDPPRGTTRRPTKGAARGNPVLTPFLLATSQAVFRSQTLRPDKQSTRSFYIS